MCKQPSNQESSMVKKDGSTSNSNSSSNNSSKQEKKQEETPEPVTDNRFPWWMGGGVLPESARAFGVFERSLEDQGNCFSVWTLSFLNPLLALGAKKVLGAEDVGIPSDEDRAERAYQAAKTAWEEQVTKTEAINARLRVPYEAALAKCNTQEAKEKVKEPKWKEPSVSKSLVRSFGSGRIILALVYYVMSALLSFVPVMILNDLVRYFEHYERFGNETDYDWMAHPWAEVAALAVVPVLNTILQTRHQAIMAHCGVFVRTAVSTMLYQKSLKVSAAGRAMTSTGQVVNMMSNDTMQLQRFLQFLGLTITAPVQIIVALYLIYEQVGNATWVGVAYMVFLAPINIVVFSVVSKMRRKVLKYSDLRVKMMNEILNGIRIIKFYAWERPFGKEVGRLRQKELDALTNLAYTTAVGFSIILLSTPIIQPIIVFITYVKIQDEPLTPATAFTTVALFNIMRFPFAFMPMGLLQYIQSKISLKRLERYLALPELGAYVQSTPHPDTPEDSSLAKSGSITIRDGYFSWVDPDGPAIKPIQDPKPPKKDRSRRGGSSSASRRSSKSSDAASAAQASVAVDESRSTHSLATSVATEDGTSSTPITLQGINCEIEAGSLVAVVGEVGSGKSSFLSALLGELEAIKGSQVFIPRTEAELEMHGFTSYCTQTPWVVNDTLRGNILFNRKFDEQKYNQTLTACALIDDIAVLPAGDMTEIGERGINLSGGQKARVSLARALYAKDTKLLLMDDPLSAVDAHVGEHLFAKAINGPIGKGITRILVTHHVHVLARCDKVLVFERGQIKHQGSYQELVDSGVDFAGAVDVSKTQPTSKPEVEDDEGDKKDELVEEKPEDEPQGEAKVVDTPATAEETAKMKKAGEELVKDEEREEGEVDGTAYIRYAKAGGLIMAFTCIVIQGVGRAAEIAGAFWLAFWADEMSKASNAGDPFTDGDVSKYAGIYAAFGVGGILCLGVRGIFLAIHRLHASKKIHDDVTDAMLAAPVAFFDVTPVGRVLNRFAADMDKLDLELTQTLSQGLSTSFNVLGAIGAIIVATNGTFLIPLVPLGWLYYVVQKWFRKTSTELQRVTSIANSPIFADFSQTLSGTSTIRAYGAEKNFFKKCKASFDNMNASYVLVQLTNYWLSLRLDVMGGLIAAFVGAVAVGTLEYDFIRAGRLGLALSYSIEMTTFLKFGVQMLARLEADMSSVERILYYTDNVEPEAPAKVPDKDPEPSWPPTGEIQLSHASLRYRDGPLVLKDLSFTVKPGEKIGICGRTGSGKSSLMIALFRISELEKDEGKILIDGVNIGEIGTATLREKLSIIPQDPVMFSNTVRCNLDPFANTTDAELWDVLKKVRLEEAIAALPKGLDEEVAEGGDNFSQGQRQLLCIARSLLRKPKILIMDEATASIDNETDAAIQEMIRDNFQEATVLTIAHRLNTIMDSDRVLVLDDGRIVEFDTPASLLGQEAGHFKAMVDKSRAAHAGVAGVQQEGDENEYKI